MNKLTTLIIPLRYGQSQVLKSQGRRQAPCSVSSTTLEVQGGMKGRSDEEEHVCSLRGDKLTLRWGKLGFKICWVKYNHYTGSFPPIDRIVKGLGRYQNACCSAVTQSLVGPQRPCCLIKGLCSISELMLVPPCRNLGFFNVLIFAVNS